MVQQTSSRVVAAFIGGILLLAPAVRAQDANKKPTPQEIEALMTQLASPDEKVRKQAQEKLVSMGDEARATLEAYVRARAAAEAALAKIDTNKVAGPSLVTLDLKDATPQAVFEEIAKQTGYDVHAYNDSLWQQVNNTKLSLKIDKQPFWVAMREACGNTGVTLYNSGGMERRLQLMQASQVGQNIMKYPAVVDGAFMVVISNLNRTNSVDLANPQNISRSMNLQLLVCLEPKVKVVRYSYMPDMEEAVDEKGNSLLLAGRNRYGPNWNSNRGLILNLNTPLSYPKDAGEKIARLKGKVKMEILTKSETLEVADIMTAKDVTKTIAGRKIVIKEVKHTNDRYYQVHVVFYRENMEQQAFYDMVNNPAVRLQDDAGREYTYNGYNSTNSSGDAYEVKMMFYRRGPNRPGEVEAGEPSVLMWEIPTGTQEVAIPFEFTDLPLP